MINRKNFMLLSLSVLLILGEILLLIDTRITYVFYFFISVALLYSFSKAGPLNIDGKIAAIFVILPILRIISLFLDFDYFWNFFLFYMCMLYLSVSCILRCDIKVELNNNKSYYYIIAIIIGSMFGIFSNYHFDLLKYSQIIYALPFFVFIEQFYFREIMQKHIDDNYGKFFGILFVSLVIGALSLTLGYQNAIYFFSVSLISGVMYSETRNIFVVFLLNFMVSFFYLISNYNLF